VAFTRAKQELIACTFVKPKGDSNSVGNLINDVLGMPLIDREEEGVIDLSTTKRTEQWTYEEDSALEEIEVDIYEVGADWIPIAETKPEVQMLDVTYNVVVPDSTRLKQRITSRNKSGNEKQNHGIFMHEILAEIVCAADVHDVVQRYEREGKLKGSNSADMEREIVRLISLPQTSRWFNPEVTVVTETSILKWGEKINRPDRVVIDGNRVTVVDYKFGALEREEYKEKVSEYMQLVRDMGYTHVEGCIWYVEKEKFVAVE
jgi:ATP-dependent exoDNAse (exonuclease V) beta subunit